MKDGNADNDPLFVFRNFDPAFKIQLLKNSPTFDELNEMEQARLSLKQREHTFKLTFSEPSPSLLL